MPAFLVVFYKCFAYRLLFILLYVSTSDIHSAQKIICSHFLLGKQEMFLPFFFIFPPFYPIILDSFPKTSLLFLLPKSICLPHLFRLEYIHKTQTLKNKLSYLISVLILSR
jgi:hypothetical protein